MAPVLTPGDLPKIICLIYSRSRESLDKFISENWPPGGEYERQRVLRIIERYEAFLSGTAPAIPLEEES